MKIRLPHPEKKRALIVVDMQAGFLPEHTRWIVPNAKAVIEQGDYDLIVESVFYVGKGSLWEQQTGWTFDQQPTIPEIKAALNDRKTYRITKSTKSAFGGDKDLRVILTENAIEEVHIIGVDINDCVLATAYDSFDAGFFTYVIEEACESSSGGNLRESALDILRKVDLTNSSKLIKSEREIKL